MLKSLRGFAFLVLLCSFCFGAVPARAQLGNSGSIAGVVKDESGGVIAGAKVEIANPVTGFSREAITGIDGSFRISNVPFNPYHLVVGATGFAPFTLDADVRSAVPTMLPLR